MVHHEQPASHRVGRHERRVVDLLGEGLERVERDQVERDAGDEHHRRRAAPHCVQARPGQRAESRDAQDAHERPAGDGLQVAGEHRQPGPDRPRQRDRQRAGAWSFRGELAPQQQHRPQILLGDGEAQLADQAGATSCVLDRESADAGSADQDEHRCDGDHGERPRGRDRAATGRCSPSTPRGDRGTLSTCSAAATLQATRASARPAISQLGMRRDAVVNAAPTASAVEPANSAAPARTQAVFEPGRRCAASEPTSAADDGRSDDAVADHADDGTAQHERAADRERGGGGGRRWRRARSARPATRIEPPPGPAPRSPRRSRRRRPSGAAPAWRRPPDRRRRNRRRTPRAPASPTWWCRRGRRARPTRRSRGDAGAALRRCARRASRPVLGRRRVDRRATTGHPCRFVRSGLRALVQRAIVSPPARPDASRPS